MLRGKKKKGLKKKQLEDNVFHRSVSGRLELRLFAAQILEIPTFQTPGETALLIFFSSTLASQKLMVELNVQKLQISHCNFFFLSQQISHASTVRFKLVKYHRDVWGFLHQQLKL